MLFSPSCSRKQRNRLGVHDVSPVTRRIIGEQTKETGCATTYTAGSSLTEGYIKVSAGENTKRCGEVLTLPNTRVTTSKKCEVKITRK